MSTNTWPASSPSQPLQPATAASLPMQQNNDKPREEPAMTLTRLLSAASVAAIFLGAPVHAQTVGPQGETATPSASVTVPEDKIAELKEGGHKAALLWHEQSDFVNAVTAGASD